MSTAGLPLLERSTAKSSYGEPEFNQWRVAIDAYQTMVGFLHLTPMGTTFTEADRQSVKRDLRRLAECVGQMDSGQRDRGVSFDEIPHIMSRISVAAMHMELSGALDRLEVDDGKCGCAVRLGDRGDGDAPSTGMEHPEACDVVQPERADGHEVPEED